MSSKILSNTSNTQFFFAASCLGAAGVLGERHFSQLDLIRKWTLQVANKVHSSHSRTKAGKMKRNFDPSRELQSLNSPMRHKFCICVSENIQIPVNVFIWKLTLDLTCMVKGLIFLKYLKAELVSWKISVPKENG